MFFSLIVITCFEFFSNFSFDTFLLIISEYFSLNCFISSSVNLISLNVISFISMLSGTFSNSCSEYPIFLNKSFKLLFSTYKYCLNKSENLIP